MVRSALYAGITTTTFLPLIILEAIYPHSADSIDGLIVSPHGIDRFHPSNIMGTDDVCSWSRLVEDQLFRGTHRGVQTVIVRIHKRRERTQNQVLDSFFFNVRSGLLQTFSPINIGIVQIVDRKSVV